MREQRIKKRKFWKLESFHSGRIACRQDVHPLTTSIGHLQSMYSCRLFIVTIRLPFCALMNADELKKSMMPRSDCLQLVIVVVNAGYNFLDTLTFPHLLHDLAGFR